MAKPIILDDDPVNGPWMGVLRRRRKKKAEKSTGMEPVKDAPVLEDRAQVRRTSKKTKRSLRSIYF